MQIRRYKPGDNKAVKALHFAGLNQFGGNADPYHDKDLDDIEGVYLNNDGEFLVGTLNDKIIAIGALKKITAIRGEIKRIRVDRKFQRHGYGQAILKKLLEIATEYGYLELCLDTVVDNIPAQRLFEKHGFYETHRGRVGAYDLAFYNRNLK